MRSEAAWIAGLPGACAMITSAAPLMTVNGVRNSWLTSPVKKRSRSSTSVSSVVRAAKARARMPSSSGLSCCGRSVRRACTAVARSMMGRTTLLPINAPNISDETRKPAKPTANMLYTTSSIFSYALAWSTTT